MPNRVIVNKNTGEIDAECGICGYGVCADYDDFDRFNDPDHMMIEITDAERTAIVTSVVVDANRKVSTNAKVDLSKSEQKLKDRVQIDVPIEIEGPGGKMVIFVEQKPEGIVIQKNNISEIRNAKKS